MLHAEGSDDWTLQIKYVQKRDNGTYECQVIIFYFLFFRTRRIQQKRSIEEKIRFVLRFEALSDFSWVAILDFFSSCDDVNEN